jgi:diadenosine tetraphosphate (Ap4A) HIT family hydrolase
LLVITEFQECRVILGEDQGAPGWCVLVLKEHAEHLADLPLSRQAQIFSEVSRVAAAIRRVFGPIRINYECLGNVVGHVHWHVIPRHADDPSPRTTVWTWDPALRRGSTSDLDRTNLRERLRQELTAATY